MLVVFEEEIANPEKVEILTVNRDTICSFVTENHPPNVKSWAIKSEKFQAVVNDLVPSASLKCPHQRTIKAVEFASFGDPAGACGAFALGKCNAPAIKQIVEKVELSLSNIFSRLTNKQKRHNSYLLKN